MEEVSQQTFSCRDEYHRKPVAEKLINLLTSDTKVSPMIINGGWGTGKTEFCHKLINLLKGTKNNCAVVYVDAFSADHADEPIMTLFAAILSLLPSSDQPTLIKKALPALRFCLKTGLKAGANYLLRQNVDELAAEYRDNFY